MHALPQVQRNLRSKARHGRAVSAENACKAALVLGFVKTRFIYIWFGNAKAARFTRTRLDQWFNCAQVSSLLIYMHDYPTIVRKLIKGLVLQNVILLFVIIVRVNDKTY